jgi:hypothetical protein
MLKIEENLIADRQIQDDLMESLKEKDLGICSCCGKKGIILTANKTPDDKSGLEIKGCWICVKNNKVVSGLGFK